MGQIGLLGNFSVCWGLEIEFHDWPSQLLSTWGKRLQRVRVTTPEAECLILAEGVQLSEVYLDAFLIVSGRHRQKKGWARNRITEGHRCSSWGSFWNDPPGDSSRVVVEIIWGLFTQIFKKWDIKILCPVFQYYRNWGHQNREPAKHRFNAFHLLFFFQSSVGRENSFCMCPDVGAVTGLLCCKSRLGCLWEGAEHRNAGTSCLQPPRLHTCTEPHLWPQRPASIPLVSAWSPAFSSWILLVTERWPFTVCNVLPPSGKFKFYPSSRLSPNAGLREPQALILYVSLVFWHCLAVSGLSCCVWALRCHAGLVVACGLRSLQPVGS